MPAGLCRNRTKIKRSSMRATTFSFAAKISTFFAATARNVFQTLLNSTFMEFTGWTDIVKLF